MGPQYTLVQAGPEVTAPLPAGVPTKRAKPRHTGREAPRPETHFSLPSPTTAILLLSSVQAMSFIFPAKG